MARQPTRIRSSAPVNLKPLGAGGLDQNTEPVLVQTEALIVARNVTEVDGVSRRLGSAKVFQADDVAGTYGAKSFADVAKYATFTPQVMPPGSWILKGHADMIRPLVGPGYLISSWIDDAKTGQAITMHLSATGTLTVVVEWDGGGSTTLSVANIPDSAEKHILLVYDWINGTLTLYFNGDEVDSDTPGIGKLLRQTADLLWVFGVSFLPVGETAEADTSFDGAMDAFEMHSIVGFDITEEDLTLDPPRRSFLYEMRRRNWQDDTNPESAMLMWSYGMDEEDVEHPDTPDEGIMYDRSQRQNHGAYIGEVGNEPRIARRAQNGQHLGTVRRAALGELRDGVANMAVIGGGVYYEFTKAAY